MTTISAIKPVSEPNLRMVRLALREEKRNNSWNNDEGTLALRQISIC